MNDLEAIFKNVKKEFCSLWRFKERDKTLEIITPYITTTNKAVSIFLTKRNDEFIISDGGWLSDGTYDCVLEDEDDIFNRIFNFYLNEYSILITQGNNIDYYFKKTSKKELVANLVFDVASFVCNLVNNSQIRFIDIKEREAIARFQKEANSYLSGILAKNDGTILKFRQYVDEKIKNIKFSAIAIQHNQITVINYVTGSTLDYFINSIGKTNIYFEVAKQSLVKDHIRNTVAFIDDNANGFNQDKLHIFLEKLSGTTKDHNIFWHEKEKLKAVI